jgi:hypothetical protein
VQLTKRNCEIMITVSDFLSLVPPIHHCHEL